MDQPDTPKIDPQNLTAVADLVEQAKGLVDAQDHILDAIQSRNSVDMRPASTNCSFLSATLDRISQQIGAMRSAS